MYFFQYLMIAFTIFGWPIYWYWLLYLISFILWYFYLRTIGHTTLLSDYPYLKKLLTDWIDDLMIAIVLWVLVGGRLWEVVLYNWHYYSLHTTEILAVWQGWMSFVGWFIGVAVMMWFVKLRKKLSYQELFILYDCIVLFLPWGILLWRIGNGLNQELYGKVVNLSSFGDYKNIITTLASFDLIKIYTKVDNQRRRNTNFFEWLFEWVFLWVVLWRRFLYRVIVLVRQNGSYTFSSFSYKPWLITGRFCIGYSCIRFILEQMRDNPNSEYIYGILKSQLYMIALFVLWVWLIRKTWKRNEIVKNY